MTTTQGRNRIAQGVALASLALALTTPIAFPVLAQDTLAEARIRKMEAEIRALQRQVFPGGDGKYFAPEVPQGAAGGAAATAQPATTPVTDLLSRMDALEAQVARLTAQVEENGNRLSKIEARLAPQATASPAPEPSPVAVAAAPAPAVTPAPASSPAPRPVTTASPAPRAAASPAPAASPRPAAPAASAPSAQRLAAVRAIVKPQTDDPGDDEYSYGFRLWDAKFYPEAQQQLKLMIDRYPRHARISYARNLLGRAFLDDGKPREAATWFLQNYQADKRGDRASDSLLYLAESMRRLNDTNRACIALAEFGDSYPSDAAGRLKAQYEQTRSAVKCN